MITKRTEDSGAGANSRRLGQQREMILFGAVVALTIGIAYGLLAPKLGAYGDDPNFLWAYHRGGPGEYRAFMVWVREFGYLLYEWLSPLFRESIFAWRVACLLLRWLASLLLFDVLRTAFPRHREPAWFGALLFAVYPGFSQQAIPVEFILHFFSLCCILASIRLSQAAALRGGVARWLRLIPAIGLSVVGVFSCEYFVGLEVMRPLLLWATMSTDPRWGQHMSDAPYGRRSDNTDPQWGQHTSDAPYGGCSEVLLFRAVLSVALPFLGVLALFLYWRLFATSITYLEPVLLESLKRDPLRALLGLAAQALTDVRLSFFDAFTLPFTNAPSGRTMLLSVGFFALLFAVYYFSVHFVLPADEEQRTDETHWARVAPIAFSLLMGVVGGMPVWGAGLRMTLDLFWDRLTLSFAIGACLFAVTSLSELLKGRYRRVFLSLLVALCAVYQFQVQNRFRRDAILIEATWRELLERAPDLEPGTVLLFDRFPATSVTDNSLNAMVNWLYEITGEPARESLKVYDVATRIEMLNSTDPTEAFSHNAFTGRLENALVLTKSPSSCLIVLRPGDRWFPALSPSARPFVGYSVPEERILPMSTRERPQTPFTPADLGAPDWCSYYERGELAVDAGDWDEVLRLALEADDLGLTANSATELRSFFVASLRGSVQSLAEKYAERILREGDMARFYLPVLRDLQLNTRLTAESALLLDWVIRELEAEIE